MKLYETAAEAALEEWALCFPPADITLCNLKTGERTQEVSMVAAGIRTVEQREKDFRTGEEKTAVHMVLQTYLAAGQAALACQGTPDTVVFSPFRRGQIANYSASVYIFKVFLTRFFPGFRLPKPVLCVHIQEQTTEVERVALSDAGIQAGAGKVFLYREPLSTFLAYAPFYKELRGGLAIHIEPRDEL